MVYYTLVSVIWYGAEYDEVKPIAEKYLRKFRSEAEDIKRKEGYIPSEYYGVIDFLEAIVSGKAYFNDLVWSYSRVFNHFNYHEFIDLVKQFFKELYEKEVLFPGYEFDRILILIENEQTNNVEVFSIYYDDELNDIVVERYESEGKWFLGV